MRPRRHERHNLGEVGWLRASVLGANDGIVSTASLILGVAAAHASQTNILLSGTAALVAGAMSMATGEYVSVHSQADTEAAALAQERNELEVDFAGERRELTEIYVRRGLDKKLAAQVSAQLMAHDALGSHARDELGLTASAKARPLQAALASAASFAVGAVLPLSVAALSPQRYLMSAIVVVSLLCLLILGGWSAKVGGADVRTGALRVTFWSALAMAVTGLVGAIAGAAWDEERGRHIANQTALLSVAQMTEADRAAIAAGIPGSVLMQNAGDAVVQEITRRWSPRPVSILCGPGNNGGDGFAVAVGLAQRGWPVRVGLLGTRDNLRGDARTHSERWTGAVEPLTLAILDGAALVVDALFGSGCLNRALEHHVAATLAAADATRIAAGGDRHSERRHG